MVGQSHACPGLYSYFAYDSHEKIVGTKTIALTNGKKQAPDSEVPVKKA